MTNHLFACVLGGTAPGAHTELHDVAWAIAPTIEAAHDQLLDAWFGARRGLHIDAWMQLDTIAGHRIKLSDAPPTNALRLYFVNLGAYAGSEFGERHANVFLAGESAAQVKAQAKQTLLQGLDTVHKDYLFAVDACLPIERVAGRHIHVTPDATAKAPTVVSGYQPLPKAVVDAWLARHPDIHA
ncbi:MAG TPA: DUF1543 domain-containing protein [Rhodanobacteraceae bacterium]